jgi:hypothetical protein
VSRWDPFRHTSMIRPLRPEPVPMIKRNLSRRLERREELSTPSGIQHLITVTYVNADGVQTGDGYRIEGLSLGDEWRRTSRSARGCPRRMITRNLSRRLERLEERIAPETVRRIWRILIVGVKGRAQEEERIEWGSPAPVTRAAPAFRKRYR